MPAGRVARRALRAALGFAGTIAAVPGLLGQANLGSQAVGSTDSAAVSVMLPAGGTVSRVEVLTLGNTGLDFEAAPGSTCSGSFSSGGQCTENVTFTPASPGQRLGAVVVLDGSNTVLGTTYLQGWGVGGQGVLLPGTMTTVAGDGNWKNESDGVQAIATDLFLPSAVALDGVGNLYIADSSHNRIRMVCAGTTTTIAGTSCAGGKGTIYTIAGVQGASGFGGEGDVSTDPGVDLNSPSGLALDGAGNLYIADTGNNRIREISAATGVIRTIAGNGGQSFSGDGGAAVSAGLNGPSGVAVDGSGNVLIADTENDRIRVVCGTEGGVVLGISCAAQGEIATVAGGGSGSLGDGGPASAALLSRPYTVAFDASWNLYIADSGNNRIRVVCAAGSGPLYGTNCSAAGVIQTVAGNGTKSFAGDSGAATSAELNSPSGLVIDPAGNLYIADTQNFRIRKVNPAGVIETVAGNGSEDFGGDGGPAPEAGLYGPYGLVLDGQGNLLIAEFLDNRVRELVNNLSVDKVQGAIRQGSTSPTTDITVENDGTAPLGLASLALSANVATDSSVTTCQNGGSLNAGAQCVVGAQFAPASSPTLTGSQAESGTIGVNETAGAGVTAANSPLAIEVEGTATPVNSTSVVVTSNLSPSTYGQSVTFTATVTTGSGTGNLTGSVTFSDGGAKISSNVTVNASGLATFTTAALEVGAHSITASYSGDSGHFASDSSASPLPQVVQEPTAVALATDGSPSGLGSPVTFTAAVTTPVTTSQGAIAPDGSLTFMDGSSPLGTIALSGNGTATLTTSGLADGMHSITAVYSGDLANHILSSTSSVLHQDVVAGSTVTVAPSANPSIYGSTVTLTATITSAASVAATGTVSFYDGSKLLGSASVTGTTGRASFPISTLAAGSHAITASYKGDSNNGPGTSSPVVVTVDLTATATTVTASPATPVAGKPATLTAVVKPLTGSTTVTGNVTFSDGGTALGTVKLGTNGTASISPLLGPGAHAIVVAYTGDSNDDPSTSTALPVGVVLATTSVSVASGGSPAVVLSQVSFSATVTGNGGTPTGPVLFSVDGKAAGSAALDANGKATLSTSSLGVGTHTVTASYGGDVNDNPSASGALTEVIQPISTTTSLGQSQSAGASAQAILVATALGATGPTPTGTVTFTYTPKGGQSQLLGSAALNSSGVASVTPDLPEGTYSVVASYGGDALHSPSTSSAVSLTGNPEGFGIAVNPPSITVATSQNITVTIGLSSSSGFADTVGMGCLSLPAGVNCHFSSDSVKLTSGGTASVQLTIDTNNPLSGGQAVGSIARPGRLSLAGLSLPGGVLLGLLFWRFRRRNPAIFMALAALFLAGAFTMTGCGGFTQNTAAPGTYTIQVGGVGTASNISHYQSVALTITK